MSEDWHVHLVFSDAKSNKFWRARTDGNTMYINYGRIGSDGQMSVKEFGSEDAARAAMTKQAQSKRKKGYEDQGDDADASASTAPAAKAAEPAKPVGLPQTATSVALFLPGDKGGGKDGDKGDGAISLDLHYDGKVIRTAVSETYASAEEAAAAFVRIQQALMAEGYKAKS